VVNALHRQYVLAFPKGGFLLSLMIVLTWMMKQHLNIQILMIISSYQKMAQTLNACSEPVCFGKTKRVRIGSAAKFVSSGAT
jgi:hypothetical protein